MNKPTSTIRRPAALTALRFHREAARLSQAQLSTRAGVPRTAIAKHEAGIAPLSDDYLQRVARVLKVPASAIGRRLLVIAANDVIGEWLEMRSFLLDERDRLAGYKAATGTDVAQFTADVDLVGKTLDLGVRLCDAAISRLTGPIQ